MKILFFDVETTGLDPNRHAIIQLSVMADINGEVMGVFNENIKPFQGAEINPDALKITGKSEADFNLYLYPGEVFKKLTDFLDTWVSKFDREDKFFLCGYNNAVFDNPFLRKFFERNGSKYFGSYFWSNSLDVMVLATLNLMDVRAEMDSFKLASVARHMNIPVSDEGLHDSLYDVQLTREIYYRLSYLPADQYLRYTQI